ncbi:MAG: zinc ribbon domain-containing protein [Polyangiaceae bacterium]
MPTYEYKCLGCNHEWEVEQSMKDPALTTCPSCSQPMAKRQISRGVGFIMKGGSSSASSGPPEPPMKQNEVNFRQRFEHVSGIKTY